MNLRNILQREMDLRPWVEGERVPWDDPDFSARVLREHLAQDNDAASRPASVIKKHVEWIHRRLLSGKPARILDLGCGPGLYTTRLAALGHTCHGIDFAPAPIEYATHNALAGCTYQLGDIRAVEYGADYDLVIFIFGAINLLPPAGARLVLEKARLALKPGGLLLLEASSLDSVDQIGNQPAMWYSAPSGLFSDQPHLCLMETFWDDETAVATERFFIIDAASGAVTQHTASTQGYNEDQLEDLLRAAGYAQIAFHPSLTGKTHPNDPEDFITITAHS